MKWVEKLDLIWRNEALIMNPITKNEYCAASKAMGYSSLSEILQRKEEYNYDYNYTILSEDSFGYWVNFNKSRKFTRRTKYCRNDFTLLRECDHCGKVSTPKKIQQRYLFGYQYEIDKPSERWRAEHTKLHPMLCMSCYNKARPYNDKLCENEELRLQVGRLKREIYKLNKPKETDK